VIYSRCGAALEINDSLAAMSLSSRSTAPFSANMRGDSPIQSMDVRSRRVCAVAGFTAAPARRRVFEPRLNGVFSRDRQAPQVVEDLEGLEGLSGRRNSNFTIAWQRAHAVSPTGGKPNSSLLARLSPEASGWDQLAASRPRRF
jgi:hypothetical protein